MIVGIAGRAGSGKDYLAKKLVDSDPRFVQLSFASELRAEVEEVMGGPCPNIWKKPTSPEVRWILQQYGTNFRRDQDPDYWVNRSYQAAINVQESGGIPVFSDVRFPNEADMVSAGGILVRVVAPVETRLQRLGELPPEHASETALDDYDIPWEIHSVLDDDIYELDVSRLIGAAVADT